MTPRIHHFEDFEVGRRFEHHWGRTVSEAESVAFAAEWLLHEPSHFNRLYAESLGFSDIVVPTPLVFAMVLGLSVEDLSESGGPFLGADAIEALSTVHPGDTLVARSLVLSARGSSSKPEYGVVEWATEGQNQHGATVLRFRRSSLVRRRQGSA